eukprot:GEMP01051681.1.p1 GENE.GEMP01051681.1~~GEMP01051681.1.p1  ORF type:complete len:361 (+),score=96.83 GEMP01051681.1:45-1127(+)
MNMDAATFYGSLPRRSSAITPRVSTAPIRDYTPRRVTQPYADHSIHQLTGTLTPRTLSPVPTRQSLTVVGADHADPARMSLAIPDLSQLRTPTFGHSNSRLGNIAGLFLEVPRLGNIGSLPAPTFQPVLGGPNVGRISMTLPIPASPVFAPAVPAAYAPPPPIHIQPPDEEPEHVDDESNEMERKRSSNRFQQEDQVYQEKWYDVSLENARLNQRIEQLTRVLDEQAARHLWELEQRDAYYEQQMDDLAETKQKLKDLVSTMHMLEFQEAKNALRMEHAEAMRSAKLQSTGASGANDTLMPNRTMPDQDAQVPTTRACNVKDDSRDNNTDAGLMSLPSFDIDSTIEAGKMFFGRLVGSMS